MKKKKTLSRNKGARDEGLQNGFSSSCPKDDAVVRLLFPCFIFRGYDGSVLISGSSAERSALPNLGLRGFEVIDDAKAHAQLEAPCPGVVSCADILELAARYAVELNDGPSWTVPTERRDGRVSSQTSTLPSPLQSIAAQSQKFAAKGLNHYDLVTLVYSLTKFDVSYLQNELDGKGVLESDQRLWGDAAIGSIAKNYAGNIRGLMGLRFDFEFRKAIIKMSSIEDPSYLKNLWLVPFNLEAASVGLEDLGMFAFSGLGGDGTDLYSKSLDSDDDARRVFAPLATIPLVTLQAGESSSSQLVLVGIYLNYVFFILFYLGGAHYVSGFDLLCFPSISLPKHIEGGVEEVEEVVLLCNRVVFD
ncbi:hypothetical protein CRYUN_Cryun03dG0068800 [Craigia yunnanensis]